MGSICYGVHLDWRCGVCEELQTSPLALSGLKLQRTPSLVSSLAAARVPAECTISRVQFIFFHGCRSTPTSPDSAPWQLLQSGSPILYKSAKIWIVCYRNCHNRKHFSIWLCEFWALSLSRFWLSRRLTKKGWGGKRKKTSVWLKHNGKKRVFGDKAPMLTADEWVHRQYGIDLNFLSLGGYNPAILTAKAKRSVCENQHFSRWEPQCYLLLEK